MGINSKAMIAHPISTALSAKLFRSVFSRKEMRAGRNTARLHLVTKRSHTIMTMTMTLKSIAEINHAEPS